MLSLAATPAMRNSAILLRIFSDRYLLAFTVEQLPAVGLAGRIDLDQADAFAQPPLDREQDDQGQEPVVTLPERDIAVENAPATERLQ
jgi:hypothetical protein